MEETKDKHQNVFDAYLKLQAETYQLLLRNVAMHKRLSEAYELLRERPDMSAEEIYGRTKDKFEEIYQDLFAMFFHPLKVLAEPYSELLRVHSEAVSPEFWFERYMDLFRMWGEAQSSFLKAMVSAYQSYLKELPAEQHQKEELTAQMRELGPANLLRSIVDEGAKRYLETMDKYLVRSAEAHQFLLPKAFFIHLRDGVSSYSKMYTLWRRYESLLHDGWGKSLEKLIDVIVKSGKSPSETGYEEFYGMFVNTFVEGYSGLLKSDEFVEVQNGVVNTLADISYNFEKTIEAQLEMFPVLPFAPRSEIDTIEKRIYDYSRGVRELERDIRGIKDRLKTIPTSEELAELSKRVKGMEKEIKRLSKKAGKEEESNG